MADLLNDALLSNGWVIVRYYAIYVRKAHSFHPTFLLWQLRCFNVVICAQRRYYIKALRILQDSIRLITKWTNYKDNFHRGNLEFICIFLYVEV